MNKLQLAVFLDTTYSILEDVKKIIEFEAPTYDETLLRIKTHIKETKFWIEDTFGE